MSLFLVDIELISHDMGNLRTGINKCNGFVIDAVHQPWRSMRDDATRKANSKYEEHRRQVKKNDRLKRVSKSCV